MSARSASITWVWAAMDIMDQQLDENCQGADNSEYNGKKGDSLQERTQTGDPLSPLLFVLVDDGLNKLLSSVVNHGILSGLPGEPSSMIANLQYTDNTLLLEVVK